MKSYQVLIDRRVAVADDVTRDQLYAEILATLNDVQDATCVTVNGLKYTPVGPIALEVTREDEYEGSLGGQAKA